VIAGDSTGYCFRENAFGGVLVELSLYPIGESDDLVDDLGSDLVAGQRV
jgi:hypothetical protein